ncbi:MAG: hypothetical protein KGZ92_06890 [Firmicutes bacterium]|nr:hypothetical protein [Dethiobacter sp.]MBS3889006.1 hypothetical protein [Bacillota bacterium]MBS4054037.1 hypothetical protein [Thermaerobacter sp.]
MQEQSVYYCVVHGDRRDMAFSSDRAKQEMVNALAECKAFSSIHVYAFAFLESQVHLALQGTSKGCVEVVSRLCPTRAGEGLGARFERHVCHPDRRLLTLAAYLHQLPVRYGHCQHPNLARYTSHSAYLGGEKYPFVDSAAMLALLSPDRKEAIRLYLGLLKREVSPAELEQVFCREENSRSHSGVRHVPDVLEAIATHIEEVTGVALSIMRGKGRSPRVVEARRRLIASAVLEHSVPVSEVAKYLHVHHSYVSRLTFSHCDSVGNERPIA